MDAILSETAEKYLTIFSSLDVEVMRSVLSEDLRHEWAPASAKPPAPRDRDGFIAHLGQLGQIMQSFPVTARQTWVNPALRQVTMWCDSLTVFHDHVKDNDDEEEWKYRGEYMFMLTMDESGGKVKHVLEFVDSKGTDRLRALMVRAKKRNAELNDTEGISNGRYEAWESSK